MTFGHMPNMIVLKEEGKVDHIGMSVRAAQTLRRPHVVHPIAVVKIEVSIWWYEEETKKVIATAEELGVAVAGYSPLGRGFLTGQIKTLDDLPANDIRRQLTRFKYFDHNLASVNALKALAEKKGITTAQLAIAWVCQLGPHVLPLTGYSSNKRALENLSGGDIVLSKADLAEIASIMAEYPVKGDRYWGDDEAAVVWG